MLFVLPSLLFTSSLFVAAIPAPHLEARVNPGPNLSRSPSVNDKTKLYRAIGHTDELLLIRSYLGRSPTWMGKSKGDFAPAGTPSLYFWDSELTAVAWCEQYYPTLCAVATFEWNPPPGVRVKRWVQADQDWHDFVSYNYDTRNTGLLSPLGQDNDWFEGPLSVPQRRRFPTDPRRYEPYDSEGFHDMQHCLTNPSLLSSLSVTDVRTYDPEICVPDRDNLKKTKRVEFSNSTETVSKRQDEDDCPFDSVPPSHIESAKNTTMWQEYNPTIENFGSLIRARVDSNKCLGVANSLLQDGSRVQVFDCGQPEVQKWVVDLSAGMPAQIRIAETNFCLDRGMDPVEVGIWTCHDASESAPQQYWVYDPSSGMIVTDFTPNGNIVSATSSTNGSPVQMTGIGGVQAGVNTIYLVYWTVG